MMPLYTRSMAVVVVARGKATDHAWQAGWQRPRRDHHPTQDKASMHPSISILKSKKERRKHSQLSNPTIPIQKKSYYSNEQIYPRLSHEAFEAASYPTVHGRCGPFMHGFLCRGRAASNNKAVLNLTTPVHAMMDLRQDRFRSDPIDRSQALGQLWRARAPKFSAFAPSCACVKAQPR
jgi:hypothetical protein